MKYSFGLGSNDNGNVLQIANNRNTNRTQNFLYDPLNRIAQAYTSGTNWGETFSSTATAPGVLPTTPGIDARGNLTSRSGVTGKTLYEPLSVSALTNNQLSGFGYDAAGNMTSNGSTTYTYDAENRLTSTSGCTFNYDGDGNRVQKTGCANIYYWPDLGGNSLEESVGSTMAREYAFFGGKRVARRDVATNAVHYFFSDHLGSTSLVTNAAGAMPPESESDYYPYGGEIVVSSPTVQDQNYKFTGKERDSESGLDEFGARYYTSGLGRFMIPDWAAKPIDVPYANFGNPQSLNLYSYVENNPTTLGDPDGHDVTFQDAKLAEQFAAIAVQSESLSQELDDADSDSSVDVQVKERGLKVNAQGSKGDTDVSQTDADGVTHVTIWVDPYRTTDDQIEHEWGHEKDARATGGTKFVQQVKEDKKKYPDDTQHNQRSVEQSADRFKDKVNRERTEFKKQQKEERKKKKEEERKRRSQGSDTDSGAH